jgi:hypothetical protein
LQAGRAVRDPILVLRGGAASPHGVESTAA